MLALDSYCYLHQPSACQRNGWAEKNPYTVNDLLQDCKASLLEGVAVARPFYSGLCMGLIAGVHYIDAKSCAPDNATNNQLMRVVLAYIEVRPQRMNEEFMKLAVEALRSAWPCSNP